MPKKNGKPVPASGGMVGHQDGSCREYLLRLTGKQLWKAVRELDRVVGENRMLPGQFQELTITGKYHELVVMVRRLDGLYDAPEESRVAAGDGQANGHTARPKAERPEPPPPAVIPTHQAAPKENVPFLVGALGTCPLNLLWTMLGYDVVKKARTIILNAKPTRYSVNGTSRAGMTRLVGDGLVWRDPYDRYIIYPHLRAAIEATVAPMFAE